METLIKNVRDIDTADRRAIEHVLGQKLRDNQQLIIEVADIDLSKQELNMAKRPQQSPEDRTRVHAGLPVAEIEELANTRANLTRVPDWVKVYEGFSDQEIADVESIILERAQFGRPVE